MKLGDLENQYNPEEQNGLINNNNNNNNTNSKSL